MRRHEVEWRAGFRLPSLIKPQSLGLSLAIMQAMPNPTLRATGCIKQRSVGCGSTASQHSQVFVFLMYC